MNNSDYEKGFNKGLHRSIVRNSYKKGINKKFYELGQNNIIKLDRLFKSHSNDYYIGYNEGQNK